jgi:D-aminopeptidase
MRKPGRSLAAAVVAGTLFGAAAEGDGERPRIRDLGVSPGILPTGRWNAITDVAGVRVGQRTLIEGDSIRTGVTAILPHGENLFQQKAPAGVFVGNGFGKAAGFLQVAELGNIETPIVLTNTLAVGTAVAAVVRWTLEQQGNAEVRSVNAVVGETNDGWGLNDIRALRVSAADVVAAISTAATGPVAEGSVGAGTGTVAFGWKGGIGTSSRKLPDPLGGYTVGALVQTNYDGLLMIDGVRVGEALRRFAFQDVLSGPRRSGGGSCMIVLATDAPLSSRNLERLAKRAVLGLARTGSFMGNGSGDFVIAFSTKNRVPYAPRQPVRGVEELENDAMDGLFLAAVESVEESVYNSLTKATAVTGAGGRTFEAIPIPRLRELLDDRRRREVTTPTPGPRGAAVAPR